MSEITISEIKTVNLSPGDTLMVKITGEHVTNSDMVSLRSKLQEVFPNNKVFIFLPAEDGDVVFEKIVQEPVESPCSTTNYCADCNCGKKEAANG